MRLLHLLYTTLTVIAITAITATTATTATTTIQETNTVTQPNQHPQYYHHSPLKYRTTQRNEKEMIEVALNDNEITLLLHSNALLTYQSSIDVQRLLQSSLLFDQLSLLVHQNIRECKLVINNDRSIDNYEIISSNISLKAALRPLFYSKIVSSSPRTAALPHTITEELLCTAALTRQTFAFPLTVFHSPSNGDLAFMSAKLNKHKSAMVGVIPSYPNESIDLLGDTTKGLVTYVSEYLKTHYGSLHPFMNYNDPQTGIYSFSGEHLSKEQSRKLASLNLQGLNNDDEEYRMALVADWAAGTYESALVANAMMFSPNSVPFSPHYTLHLGDCYYVGEEAEINANFLGKTTSNDTIGIVWPHGEIGSFAVPGNHEMYSRGFGFFDVLLPTLGVRTNASKSLDGQKASYWALENEYWRVIGLDTGYNSYNYFPYPSGDASLPDDLVRWLKTLYLNNPDDHRGLIFLSHHQPVSAFETPFSQSANQLAQLINSSRTSLWLFGHEHRLSFYGVQNVAQNSGTPLNTYGRCIGNSGFPTLVDHLPKTANASKLEVYDDRLYKIEDGIWDIPVGFNGWVQMRFNGPTLTLDYYSLSVNETTSDLSSNSTWLIHEEFQSQMNIGIVQSNFTIVDPNLTVVMKDKSIENIEDAIHLPADDVTSKSPEHLAVM